jgi:hypothetical protein
MAMEARCSSETVEMQGYTMPQSESDTDLYTHIGLLCARVM